MKKITKLGLLTLGLAGCLVALNASASTGDNKEVSLTLTQGNNSCTIVDYNFGTTGASAEAIQLGEKTGDITCLFLENQAVNVNLQLADLKAGSNTIAKGNFSFAVDADANPVGQIGVLGATNASFASLTTIYEKDADKLGSWASILTISGTVPAGTPSGTYTGALDLLIQ